MTNMDMTSAATQRTKILYVEDDSIDQRAFARLVEEQGLPYEYSIAGSATEAVNLISQAHFDVVLSDFYLPDGTAFNILSLATKPPVIVVTGSGDEEIAVKAMKNGAYDYLIKDVDRNYLKILPTTVENTLRRRRAEEERDQLIRDLKEALEHVHTLSGLLPICSYCKKIRDDKNYWHQIEAYISQHSEAHFTHGLCPDCYETIVKPQFAKAMGKPPTEPLSNTSRL